MNLTIVGGGHGAGKTTYCQRLVAERGWAYLTNEVIRRENPAGIERAAIHRILRERIDAHLHAHEPFIFEHVMSGRFVDRLIELARKGGFSVELVYLDVVDAARSLKRVDHRVTQGGHDVERDRVADRLLESRVNFWREYRARADRWTLFESDGAAPIEIARGGVEPEIVDQARFTGFQARLGFKGKRAAR